MAISVVFSILPKQQKLNHVASDQPKNLEHGEKVLKISGVKSSCLAFLTSLK